jgi:hypothetical protein
MNKRMIAVLVPLIIGVVLLSSWALMKGKLTELPGPIDPQIVQDQDDMTWDDYKPIPGINWADPSLKPEREFKMALVAVDFSDQPFVITQPKHSDLFGNPQVDPISAKTPFLSFMPISG